MLGLSGHRNQVANVGARLIAGISILGFIVLGNLAISNWSIRADLTKHQLYTLSDYTKSLCKSLDDIVNVKVYFSKKLPPYISTIRQQVSDMLREYAAYANGNLIIEFVDPASDPKIESEVRQLGIPQIQMNVIEKDQRQAVDGYLGIGLFYEDKREVIPVVQTLSGLEYELTVALRKLVATETKTVGIMTGQSGFQLSTSYGVFEKELSRQYQLAVIEPGQALGDAVDTVMVLGPRNLGKTDQYHLDQAIMAGKPVLFFVDQFEVGEGFRAAPVTSGVQDMLGHYGIQLGTSLVLDKRHGYAAFSTGFFSFTLPYPFWPLLTRDHFETENPVFTKVESIVLPWPAGINFTGPTQNLTFTPLAKSSDQAWTKTGYSDLNPRQSFEPDSPQQFVMMAHVEGSAPSFFDQALQLEDGQSQDYLGQAEKAELVIVGDSDFLSDQLVRQYPSNLTVGLNLLDWLTLDSNLITIRSRDAVDFPLNPATEAQKGFFRVLGMAVMPLFLGIWGVLRWLWLNQQRRRGMG